MRLLGTFLSTFLVLFVLVNFSQAGDDYKWGKETKENLQMKVFELDSSADAIVLFDVADMTIDENFDLRMKRHCRIKILTENGKDRANIFIRYYHEDDIYDLKAQVILPNGKKLKMDKKLINEEEFKSYYKQKVFSIPGVEVGSVIEYKYELRSKYIYRLEPWFFQSDLYTVHSKITVMLQPGLNYKTFFRNADEEPEPIVEEILLPGRPKARRYVWERFDLPAIKKEPYMFEEDDYKMALYFQLIEYSTPYTYQKFVKSWEDISNRIYTNSYHDFVKEGLFLLSPQELYRTMFPGL